MSDFDGAWKEALEHFLAPFLAFFFPDAFAEIDWSVDFESLESRRRDR